MFQFLKSTVLFLFVLFISNIIFAQNAEKGKLDALNQKIKKGDNSSQVFLERAEIYNRQNLFEKSNADYEKVIQNYAQGSDKNSEAAEKAYYRLADDFMYRNSDAITALKYAMKGLNINAENTELLLVKAEALYRMGQNEKSFEIYESLLEKEPKNSSVLGKYALKLESRNPDKAKAFYEDLIKTETTHKRALYFLGMYYTQASNEMNLAGKHPKEIRPVMEKGVNYLAKYQKQSPEDEGAKEALIQLYQFLGEAEKAAALQN